MWRLQEGRSENADGLLVPKRREWHWPVHKDRRENWPTLMEHLKFVDVFAAWRWCRWFPVVGKDFLRPQKLPERRLRECQ